MAWYDYFLPKQNEQDNALAKSIEPIEDTPVPDTHILETIAKEAKYNDIDPMDHSNAYMMQSYDHNGKKYYFEDSSTDKLNADALRNMSRHHLISSIIGSRINQCAEFAQYSPDEDLGYKIVLKEEHSEMTDADRQNIVAINRFLQQCGTNITDYELTFESFIRQIVRDSLIYDQACFEIVKNRKGQITSFMPVDATTIKKAAISKEELKIGRRDPNGIRYVQVINNKIVAEYKQDELCFGVRRPRTDIKSQGHGNSELYELYSVLNNLFNAETYNAANFTNGINANGIIAIKSKMNPKLFRSFRREFYQMLNGVGNAKRTPLIQLDPDEKEDISSINLQPSNREMEYNTWMNYLIKVACGVYQIDPAEIGFVFGSESQSSSLFGTDPSARVLMGKEKGLRPLVRSLQSWINRYIIDQIDDRYKLVFTGLDSVSALDKMKLEEHKMKYMTLNEIRNIHDLPELEDGDILASAYTAIKTAVIKEQGILVANEVGKDKIDSDLEEVIDDEHEKELELEGEEVDKTSDEILDEDFDKSKKKDDEKRTKLTDKEKKEREKEKERRKDLDKPDYSPLPGDENVKTKPSKYTKTELAEKVREEMKKPGKDEFIRAASKVSGVKKKIIEEVYDRGLAAWSGSHRPGATAPQWAKARVYSFLSGGKTQSTADKDLWEEHLESKKSLTQKDVRETFINNLDNPIEKKFEIKQRQCERSDGTKGEYVLVMETESGEIREFCHFSYEDAQNHIGVIEIESNKMEKGDDTYVAPKSVADKAQKALDAKEKYDLDYGTPVGWKRARQLANGENISLETVKRMYSFFSRHEKNKDIPEGKEYHEDAGAVMWDAWGGDEGFEWCKQILSDIEDNDE